jgi:hypothetical protein
MEKMEQKVKMDQMEKTLNYFLEQQVEVMVEMVVKEVVGEKVEILNF